MRNKRYQNNYYSKIIVKQVNRIKFSLHLPQFIKELETFDNKGKIKTL